MFTYGKDIPLDGVVYSETIPTNPSKSSEPSEYSFTYGKEIFPEEG